MTDRHDRGKDDARYRDAGIAEALLKLGSEVATTQPGVLTHCDGVWVHHVCDGRAVEVRVVSGSELAALQERIALFQARRFSWPVPRGRTGVARLWRDWCGAVFPNPLTGISVALRVS